MVQRMIGFQPFIGGGKETAVQGTFKTLVKILGNIVGCGNAEAKYRSLKMGNQKITSSIVDVPGV